MRMNKFWFYGKLVIVTGASSGIGRALTQKLSSCGAKIVGVGRSEKSLEELRTTLHDFTPFVGDVSTESFWLKLSDYLRDNGLIPQLIINCAGVMPQFKKVVSTSQSEYTNVFDVNLFAAIRSVELIAKKTQDCAVVNVASSAALCPVGGQSGYCASKSALKAYTECLAVEEEKRYVGLFMPGFAFTKIFREQELSKKDVKLIKKFASSPEKIANKIFSGIAKKKKRLVIGFDAKLMSFFYKLFPKATVKIIRKVLKKTNLKMFEAI